MPERRWFAKTRRGNVVKHVKEHYLRDDIACGVEGYPWFREGEPPLAPNAARYLVLDTNVGLAYIDLIEYASAVFVDTIVPQTVMAEIKHRNEHVYARLCKLIQQPDRRFYFFANEHHRETHVSQQPGESPNDFNDRAIRVVCGWYAQHLGPELGPRVLHITNDKLSREQALKDGLSAVSMDEYVRAATQDPQILDRMVAISSAEDAGEAHKEKLHYSKFLSAAAISAGLKNGSLVQGMVRAARDNAFRGRVAVKQQKGGKSETSEVTIDGRIDMNRAIDGDLVAVRIKQEQEPADSCQGEVVGIIKTNWRPLAGSLDMDSKRGQSYLFHPVARNMPYVRVHTVQPDMLAGKRIVVTIDSWDERSSYPNGHYVRTLGLTGDRDAENEVSRLLGLALIGGQVIFVEHDVPVRPFSTAVLACLPPEAGRYTIKPTEVSRRVDLRNTGRRICSIDPPGCEDIDDALHCMRLDNGNFEVGVHIADVTHFVRPGTALDLEAAVRGTTVYLVEKRIDMLPRLLNADLCSLRPNVDRLAFSVTWEMTAGGEVVPGQTKFFKSVIHSDHAFSYGEAQSQMDDPSCVDPLTEDVRNLNALAKQLKAKRVAMGALNLASPEVKFSLDTETNNPLDVGMYQLKEANSLVEEFMLLANITVAAQIEKHYPQLALLRRHPDPLPAQFEPLIKAAESVGIKIEVGSSKALADSLDNAVRDGDEYFNKALRILSTRCMQQAVYFCSGGLDAMCGPANRGWPGQLPSDQYRHYGLAAPIYTHYTSPIRRYADVMVHRLLAATIGVDELDPQMRDKDAISDIADNINRRHLMAQVMLPTPGPGLLMACQMAGRASVELHTLFYFKDRVVTERGIILRIRENGLGVLVPRFGIESMIRMSEDDSNLSYCEESLTLTVQGHTFHVFDWLVLEISVDNSKPHRPGLSLKIVEEEEHPANKRQKKT